MTVLLCSIQQHQYIHANADAGLRLLYISRRCNTNVSHHCVLSESMQMSDEKRLIKHLLDNYERVGIVGRPVYNTSETVHVSYGLALIQILDLDEKNQVLTTNVWSRYVSVAGIFI